MSKSGQVKQEERQTTKLLKVISSYDIFLFSAKVPFAISHIT